MDLVINIMQIFFCLSQFSQMHAIVSDNHIGDMTMKIIDLEIKRHALRQQELNHMQERISDNTMRELDRLLDSISGIS